jgi:predicted nucleic acid-binding protein
MSCDHALLFLEDVRKRSTIIALESEEYFSALTSAVEADLAGGRIYDRLIAACALKWGADNIYTWNIADFQRLGPEISHRVRTP